MLRLSVLLFTTVLATNAAVLMNREGCGTTKACLFKPAGCDPNLDCTIGLIFFVEGPNKLRVEMVATSLIPAVQQQYIAIAFSNDTIMGGDFVTECVMSDMGQFAGWEPEVFVSYNHGKSNDRIFLEDHEHRVMITNVSSQVEDGRLVCHFTQQIIPEIDRRDGLIWTLDKSFYVMGATGSAQPDEVNAHDMNRGSHFYPIVSSAKINPSQLGEIKYDHPLKTNVVSSMKSQPPMLSEKPLKAETTALPPAVSSSIDYSTGAENSSAAGFSILALTMLLLRITL